MELSYVLWTLHPNLEEWKISSHDSGTWVNRLLTSGGVTYLVCSDSLLDSEHVWMIKAGKGPIEIIYHAISDDESDGVGAKFNEFIKLVGHLEKIYA